MTTKKVWIEPNLNTFPDFSMDWSILFLSLSLNVLIITDNGSLPDTEGPRIALILGNEKYRVK